MKVLKFGGNSVANKESIQQSVAIVEKESRTDSVAVVVSAMGSLNGEPKVTDQLKNMGKGAWEGQESYQETLRQMTGRHRQAIETLLSAPEQAQVLPRFEAQIGELASFLRALTRMPELSKAALDELMSFGERFAAPIIAGVLRSNGMPAEDVDARELVMTNDQFGDAEVNFSATDEKIRNHFQGRTAIQVITGFIGSTDDPRPGRRRTTTIGRDGTDYTAALVGAALDSPENRSQVQIWKESAIHTANPKKVRGTRLVRKLTTREAGEMSNLGMNGIHSRTTIPLRRKKIPLFVRSTANPDDPGTRIDEDKNGDTSIIKGISSMSNVAQFNLTGAGMQDKRGLASRVFGALANKGISVSFIVQVSSEQSVSFTVPDKDAKEAEIALRKELAHELETEQIDSIEYKNITMIAIVGEKMKGQKGTLGKVALTLANSGVNIISVGQSPDEFNITVIVETAQEDIAVQALHDAFFPETVAEDVHQHA